MALSSANKDIMKPINKTQVVKSLRYKQLISLSVGTISVLAGFFITTQAVQALNIPIINDPTRPSEMPLDTPEFRTRQPKESLILPPAPQSKPLPNEGRLVLKKVEFTGNTVISDEELQKITRSFLNRPLTVRDLEELRTRITAVYVDAGYINSGAVIPGQSSADGLLKIKVVEGNLTEVRLEGMGRLRDDYLCERLLIGAGSPLNLKKLQEKYQLLLTDRLIEQ